MQETRVWRSSGEGHGNLLQYSCLENPMDREARWATMHGVTKSWTWLRVTNTHTLMLGKIEGQRRRGQQRMRWLYNLMNSMDINLSKYQEIVENREAWFAIIHAVAKSWMWLSDWATPPPPTIFCFFSILLEAPLPPSSVTLLHLNKFHSLLHKASSIYTND